MRYFFILGSNPTLSIAELAAIFNHGEKLSLIQTNIALVETSQKIMANIIKNIGGTIKFGQIINEINAYSTAGTLTSLTKLAPASSEKGKFMFGISYYGKNILNIKPLAMEFKKSLKNLKINSRWVISREPVLSSVVVEQNKLTTDRGIEIVLIHFNKKLLIGKTLSVQPFKELSFRDYGRPARDDRSGMLPPKLAQIMINLSQIQNPKSKIIQNFLDPFCGSGTIITEAMLMGYRNLIGADISEKAIEDTNRNIEWTKKNYELGITNYELYKTNSIEISKKILPALIDAVITEPYLGPPRGLFDIQKTIKELEQLYSRSLAEFKKILKPNGRIVMIWPVFAGRRQNAFLNPNLSGLKIINPIPENLRTNIFVKLTNRNTIIYGREQQKIFREIVVLERLTPL